MSLLPARDAGSERCGSNKSRRCKKLPGSPPLDDLTLMEANPSSSFRFPERVDFCWRCKCGSRWQKLHFAFCGAKKDMSPGSGGFGGEPRGQ
jgi:hypothetical protein